VLPEYPEAARKAGIEGEVMLEVTVDRSGKVADVSVERGVPDHRELDKSAEEAIRQWRFEPATRDGEPFKTSIKIPVKFSLDDDKQQPNADTMPVLVPGFIRKPVYPEDARKAGIEGKIVLEVTVCKDGTVGSAEIVEGVPEYPSLGRSAIEAVSQWRFKPATKDGEPVEVGVKVPLEFSLDSDKKDSPGETPAKGD
jgi:TonB family protein